VLVAGDVFPDNPADQDPFRHLMPLLEAAEVVAGNCEGVYCDDPSPAPTHKHFMVAPQGSAAPLNGNLFRVLSCANNHAMDGGYEGLRSTKRTLEGQGIQVVGAGENLGEALRPVIVTNNAISVAFVAVCSVFPVGYEARESRPGIAPLRVRTFYSSPDPNFWEPGIAPAITTLSDEQDWARCRATIEEAHSSADCVVVLAHWGYSSAIETILPYENDLARRMVEAGADAVVCCHHHSLRGIDVHQGRPIFHGVGALVHHLRTPVRANSPQTWFAGDSGEEDFPLFPFHPDARMSGLARLRVGTDGLLDAGFIPAMIRRDGSTTPLRASDAEQEPVFRYLRRLTEQSGFSTKLSLESWGEWAYVRISG